MSEKQAMARFARTVAAAAEELARSLDAGDGPPADPLDAVTPPLGPMQRSILTMDRVATPRGVAKAEVMNELDGRAGPVVLQVLETLERRNLVERVPGSSPTRFRLTAASRHLRSQNGASETRASNAG